LRKRSRRDPNFVSAYCYAAPRETICSSFSTSIQRRNRISLADAAVKDGTAGFAPIQAEGAFCPWQIISSDASETTTALLEELAIARPGLPNSTPFFLFFPATSIAARNHFHEAGARLLHRVSRSIREIRMLTIFWATPFVLLRRFS